MDGERDLTPGYGDRPVPPGAFAPRPQRPAPPTPEQLASFGQRAAAFVIDLVVVGVLAAALILGIDALTGDEAAAGSDDFVLEFGLLEWLLLLPVLLPAVGLLYFPVVMAATNGRTLGKALLRCRVVRPDGRRIGFWFAVYREVLVKGVLVGIAAALTAGIGYVVNYGWAAWDRRRRTVHDLLVETLVVRS